MENRDERIAPLTGLMLVSPSDLDVFGKLSGDTNPVHYGMRRDGTSGPRVVYGVLVGIKLLDEAQLLDKRSIGIVRVDFFDPIYAEVPFNYFEEEVENCGVQITAKAGGHLLCRIKLECRESQSSSHFFCGRTAQSGKIAPQFFSHPWQDRALTNELGLSARIWSNHPGLLSAFAALSRLSGVCIPGQGSLLRRLMVQLRPLAAQRDSQAPKELAYNVNFTTRVKNNSEFYYVEGYPKDQVNMTPEFFFQAVRKTPKQRFDARNLDLKPFIRRSDMFVVIGGSRGIGAAVLHFLNEAGAVTMGVSRTWSSEAPPKSSKTYRVQGDIVELATQIKMRDLLKSENLSVNGALIAAAGQLNPVWFQNSRPEGVEGYVRRESDIVSSSLALLDSFLADSARIVLLSTDALSPNPKGGSRGSTAFQTKYPHYLRAKRSQEALASLWAQGHKHSDLRIFRLPRIATDFLVTYGETELELTQVTREIVAFLAGLKSEPHLR